MTCEIEVHLLHGNRLFNVGEVVNTSRSNLSDDLLIGLYFYCPGKKHELVRFLTVRFLFKVFPQPLHVLQETGPIGGLLDGFLHLLLL